VRIVAILLTALWGGLTVVVYADEPPLRWLRNLDDARQIAQAEHKDLLVNFTALEWCGHCMDLEEGVLSRREFRAAAADFVLVDVDFPGDRSELGTLEALYGEWTKRYKVLGFPTIVLMDQAARPYCYFTGYDDDVDVARFMVELAAAKKLRQVRDRELAEAKELAGPARAHKMHAAIAPLAAQLGTLEERGDDPLLVFYQDEAKEIRQLDADNTLGLRAVYDARQSERDACRRRETILQELECKKEDCPATMARISRLLEEVTDDKLRFALKKRRYNIFEWTERYADALAELKPLVDDPACPADDRNPMLRRQASLLARTDRFEDGLALYDKQIAIAKDAKTRAYFLSWKANALFGTGRHEETIATCRDLRMAVKPRSSGWVEATGYLAFALEGAGRHSDALSVYEEQLAYDRDVGHAATGTLLSIARCHHAMGHKDQELQTLDAADKALAKEVVRTGKLKQIEAARKELQKAREALADLSG